MAVPVEGNWEDYQENFHSVHPEVNEAYFNSDQIDEGEVAAFTVDDNGITLYSTVNSYNHEQDGVPSEEELTEQIV